MNNKLEKIIFKFLDEKNFIVKEAPDNYYFLVNEGDKHSQIRVKKNNMGCYIYYELSGEIESFFSLTETESKDVLIRYVENILNIEVPYGVTIGECNLIKVEDTLNI